MALAYHVTTFHCPEVLLMNPRICRRHQQEMTEVGPGNYRCPIKGCESSYDDEPGDGPPPSGGPARRLACVKPRPMGPSPLMDRAAPYWLAHLGLPGPLPPIPQCNASDDYSVINGPPAPGGGGSKSGRRRKKGDRGGKTFVDTPWGSEGGTNTR